MKKKIAITIIGLTVVFSIVACGNKDSLTVSTETNSIVEDSESIDTEVVATESIETTEVQDSKTETELPFDIVEQGDYPDNRSDHQKSWDVFCKYYNESDYGTTTKGKSQNELPYCGPTGYDSRLLEERTTDKGYTVMYDTATGRVYYCGMVMPTGSVYGDTKSGAAVLQYIIDNNLNNVYDITYAEFQEILGVYTGN